jgi:hypothetical protein
VTELVNSLNMLRKHHSAIHKPQVYFNCYHLIHNLQAIRSHIYIYARVMGINCAAGTCHTLQEVLATAIFQHTHIQFCLTNT